MIDEGAQTDLALELHEYDTSPSAEYESWMLLEPNTTEPGRVTTCNGCNGCKRL